MAGLRFRSGFLACSTQLTDRRGRAEAVTLLMLAVDDMLTPSQRAALSELTRPAAAHPALAGELSNVRAQLTALWTHAKVG
jgi:hypothetical protein